MTEGVESRRVAYRAVRRVRERGAWSVQAVGAELQRSDLDARDRAFAANLAYETLRWEGTLDWLLARATARPLSAVEEPLLDVLRIGAWQLQFGGVPDSAAVGTAVEVARAEFGERATGFVNGVLRGLARKAPSLPDGDDDESVALRLGYPRWVVAAAVRRFGARAHDVLAAGNRPPGVTLRAAAEGGESLEAARQRLVAELAESGVEGRPGALAPEAVRAPGADPGRLAAVTEGRAAVQDEASMVVSRAVVAGLGAAPLVADTCAGPGGKSAHLATLGARVVATELHPARARLVAETAVRLHVPVRVAAADATVPPLKSGRFDAVLVDAPCSGLGVVRRRPELRWRRQEDDLGRLADLQLRLLLAAADLVRPGGRLVYAACTWPVEETEQLAETFDAAEGDRFAGVDVGELVGLERRGPKIQLDPAADDTDAMFIAAWLRTAP